MAALHEDWQTVLQQDPMRLYRTKRESTREFMRSRYNILGFISSGTYGRVYKASLPSDSQTFFAIKKFKPDKEGDVATYTGISQSAIREIALNREIDHDNVARLIEVILEDKSISMVFEYADHDFLKLIHHHSQTIRCQVSTQVLKSLTYQLLNGLVYLHACHILHRDLKPANILVTERGVVKIGDLGLARLIYEPLQPLFSGDKVVVTIWYRAPELLLGARHYHKAIDLWAVGCVIAEVGFLRPIFKGEEAKIDSKKNVPFQRDQLIKIFETVGTPDEVEWPGLVTMPDYNNMKRLDHFPHRLEAWCIKHLRQYPTIFDLLRELFTYDPDQRLTAANALQHKWFKEDPQPCWNAFENVSPTHIPPPRRITIEEGSNVVPVQTAHPPLAAAAPGPFPQSKPGSVASFGSMSGGTMYTQTGSTHPRKKAKYA
ncbi:CMGC/CDK/CDK8 protein kinase, partial [Cylindrobasidium torrendii FP15055 ss-10]